MTKQIVIHTNTFYFDKTPDRYKQRDLRKMHFFYLTLLYLFQISQTLRKIKHLF